MAVEPPRTPLLQLNQGKRMTTSVFEEPLARISSGFIPSSALSAPRLGQSASSGALVVEAPQLVSAALSSSSIRRSATEPGPHSPLLRPELVLPTKAS